MLDTATLSLFLAATTLLAVTPGPGLMYVTARAIAGGRAEGLASSFGTAVGGMAHVLAGAIGLSALVMASAEAFTVIKIMGAAYLVWIGIRTIREARPLTKEIDIAAHGVRRAFGEGILVEALNPKTAAFFLAFLPQFIDPARGDVALQFIVLGTITVTMNTLADVIATLLAARARAAVGGRSHVLVALQRASGAFMCALGVLVLAVRRPA